jgi:murein DD-endopeptidase MepM/ murein hydrolase activator NlpD
MRQAVSARIRPSIRFSVLGFVALAASACSQTDRFDDPFSNPFSKEPNYTGSVNSAPSGSVSSQPLPPPSGGGYQPSSSYGYQQPSNYQSNYAPAPAQAYPPYRAPAPQPNYQQQSYQQQSPQPQHSGYQQASYSQAAAPVRANSNNNQAWYPNGQQQAAAQKPVAPPRSVVAAQPPIATDGVHTVQPGETLFSVARTRGVPAGQLAEANGFGLDHRVRIGEKLRLPQGSTMKLAAAPAPMMAAPAKQMLPPAPVAAPLDQPKMERVVATATPKPVVAVDDDEPRSQTSGGTDFRYPVRGRIISGFGSKPNGSTNDGINFSVPEGTPIKAAEGGVVAYAGNELKGFGNLVLIRHAGEWVTAYAHASEIMVKRGDVVRRGQVIAKSGATGNVSAPQLHFEVRRGATPVDPMDHLPQG